MTAADIGRIRSPLLEQACMGARAGQVDRLIVELVDQEPVPGDMALPEPLPGARQGMVPMPGLQRLPGPDRLDDGEQAGHVQAALPEPLHVPLERLGRDDGPAAGAPPPWPPASPPGAAPGP